MGEFFMSAPHLSIQTRQFFSGSPQNILAGFLLDRQIRGLAAGTIEYYRGELELLCRFLDSIGVIHVEEITPDVLRRYLVILSQTRNAGGIHAAYRAIRAYLNWYSEELEPEGWKNPIRRVKSPKTNKQALPGVELTDVQRLIDVSKNKRDMAIFIILTDTGVRASELLALNVGDVNLVTGMIEVRHGKGNKRRVVFFGRQSRKILRRYLQEREEMQPNNPLFTTDEGDRLSYYGLTRMIMRRAKDAGISPAPACHDFRRCYAVNMLRNGCDLARLAELMGHNSLEVLRRYLYLVPNDLAAAHAQAGPIDRLVG
jgi:integrase/recombinase XerD